MIHSQPQYHVFLSHNSRDKGSVEPLALMLREKGLNPFLDKWNLVPGEPIEDSLVEALENSDSAVIFVGPGGEGPWQSEEMRDILKRAVKSHNEFRAIPVLLPGASAEALEKSFLGSRLWIEFKDIDDDDALLRMAKAIRGEASGDESFKLPDEPAPYRGLERFERIENPEEDYFFGRDDEIRALVERLVKERFVAVVGASGNGKSSLIRAGLSKQLAEEIHPGIRRWQTITVEPGSAPFRSLAVQVAVAVGIPVGDRESWIENTVQKWSAEPDGVRTSIETLFADAPEPLLVFIDQFEELFTHRKEGEEHERLARNFVANLTDIWKNGGDRVRVIVALRADFVERCLEIGPLKELLQDRTMLVGEVGDDALREIVKEPAARVGAFLEKGLMERILTEVRSQSGSLPLLQQALHELWRNRKGAWLTHDAYEASGGVARALNDQAQGAYKSLDGEQKMIADGLFPRLITLGEGVSDTRRRVKRNELYPEGVEPAAVNDVIDKLSGKDARILVTTREGGSEEDIGAGEDFVEFTHEALLGNWQHLVTLLDSERESIRKHRTLTTAAEEWESKPENERHKFLLRAGQLVIAEQWATEQGGDARLNQVERRFLDESIQERTAEEARKAKIARRLKLLSIGATAAAVIAVVFAFAAINQKEVADVRRGQAQGVIDFMLGDLRTQLKSIGKLDSVGDKAMDYFAKLDDDLSGKDALARAQALRQIGEVRLAKGRVASALEVFQKSHDYAQALHDADPANEKYLFELGQAVFYVGNTALEQGDLDAADESFARYMTISRDLLSRQPENAEYQYELLCAHSNLGTVALKRGDVDKTISNVKKALSLNQRLVAPNPKDLDLQFELAESHSWMGSALLQFHRLAEAEQSYQQAFDILQTVIENEDRARFREEPADLARFLAEVKLHQGEAANAKKLLQLSLAIDEALVKHDRTNAKWLHDLLRTRYRLAHLNHAIGEDCEVKVIEALVSEFMARHQADVSDVRVAENLSLTETLLSLLQLASGDQETAKLTIDSAWSRVENLQSQPSADRRTIQRAAVVAETRGRIYEAIDQRETSQRIREAALALQKDETLLGLVGLAIRHRLYTQLGNTSDASRIKSKLDGAGFADPRYAIRDGR